MSVFKLWNLKEEEVPESACEKEVEIPKVSESIVEDPVEPDAPLTKAEIKAEKKEHRRRMKSIVHHFRIRSFGLDALALLGIGVTVLLSMFFRYGFLSAGIGGGLILLAGILLLISWIPARGEVKREEADPEERKIWHRKVYVIGIRTVRLMTIFLAVPLSLTFILAAGSREVTWIRWGMFAVEFVVLAVAGLMALHTLRGKRTGKVWLWRILAVLLVTGTACGQVYFNRVPWTSMQKGKQLDHFADLKILMEQEKEDTPPEDGTYTDRNGRKISRDEYLKEEICGSDGSLLYTYEHYNTDIAAVLCHYGPVENGVQPTGYTVFTREEKAEGLWKIDCGNLVWFAVYPVILLFCYLGWKIRGGRRLDPDEETDAAEDPDEDWAE